MSQLTNRIGTDSETASDINKLTSLWDNVFTSYKDEIICKMPYVDYRVSSISAATLSAYQQFKINSIYDPDLTGTGGQPLGRDTWASIYNYYKVLEAKVTVKVFDLTSDATGGITYLVYPSVMGGMLDITANPPTDVKTWLQCSLANDVNHQQSFSKPEFINVIAGRGSGESNYSMTWKANMFDTAILNPSSTDTWTPVGSDPDDLNYFSNLAYNPQTIGSRSYVIYTNIEFLVAFKQVNRTLLNTLN